MKKNYYLFASGKLGRQDNTLVLEREGKKKFIPVEKIESISSFGELDLNTRALSFLSQKEIALHVFNHNGWYGGSFVPRRQKVSGKLLTEQVKTLLDPVNRLQIAREFIDGAMHNMLRILQRQSQKINGYKERIEGLIEIRRRLSDATTINGVMAVEGAFRQNYYPLLAQLTGQEFITRVKQPPLGILNCMISFGNTLLYTRTLNKIYQTQLDPTVSYLHEPCEMRFSLSLDISELFKPIIIDRLIVSLLNKNIITENDFDQDLNSTLLTTEGMKKYVQNFDDFMEETVFHPTLKRKVSYNTLLLSECYKLIRSLMADEKYRALHMWW
jgi:CRISPR-associated protein Cas1